MNYYASVVYGATALFLLALCFFMQGENEYVAAVALAAGLAWVSCYAGAWVEEGVVEERMLSIVALVTTFLAAVIAFTLLVIALFF